MITTVLIAATAILIAGIFFLYCSAFTIRLIQLGISETSNLPNSILKKYIYIPIYTLKGLVVSLTNKAYIKSTTIGIFILAGIFWYLFELNLALPLIVIVSLFVIGIVGFILSSWIIEDKSNIPQPPNNKFPYIWWKRSTLSAILMCSFFLSLLFSLAAFYVLKHNIHETVASPETSILNRVLNRMQEPLDQLKEENNDGKQGANERVPTERPEIWFKLDPDSIEEWTYQLQDDKAIELVYSDRRNKFLNAYFDDPSDAFKTSDPNRMIGLVTKERSGKLNPCGYALGVLLLQYATAIKEDIWGKFDEKFNDTEKTICSDRIFELLNVGENHKETEKNIKRFKSNVIENLTPTHTNLFNTLKGSSFKPAEARLIYNKTQIDTTATPPNLLHEEVIIAQIKNIRELVTSDYRVGNVLFGPIQLILLSFFFMGCVILGARRTFGKSAHGLKALIDFRATEYSRNQERKSKKAKNDSLPQDWEIIAETRQDLDDELAKEASFPITFCSYILPTVGFIGTVIGIAASLSNAGEVVSAAGQGISAQKEAIGVVTSALGVAFDTTLIALVTGAFIWYYHEHRRSFERAFIRTYVPEITPPPQTVDA